MVGQKESLPAVWVHTTKGAFNAYRDGGYGAFLTPAQQQRLERIRQGRMLFDGRHEEYFVQEQRSQFNFKEMLAQGDVIRPYIMIPAIRLVCCKIADLLFGQEAKIELELDQQDAAFAELRERSALDQLFYNTALECTYEAEAFLEARRINGEVYVCSIPADEIFPMGQMGPDNQYPGYVRYRVEKVGPAENPLTLLLETWYEVGQIRHTLRQLDENGVRMSGERDLKSWPLPAGEPPLAPIMPTGASRNTVTYCYNELCRKTPVSVVDRLISLQDALNAKETQIDVVLAKHSDPKLAAPAAAAGPDGTLRADHEVHFFRSKEEIPQYIVWQAELDAAQKSKSQVLALLCITAEISPSLLGLKEGAAPDAARKLRLEATNTVAMVQRVASNWKPAIRRAISIAQELETTTVDANGVLPKRYDRSAISVKMRDGLPIDTLDQATEIATLRGAQVISVERAVGMQIEDDVEADAEIKRLEEEREAATPSVLLGEPEIANQQSQIANPKTTKEAA